MPVWSSHAVLRIRIVATELPSISPDLKVYIKAWILPGYVLALAPFCPSFFNHSICTLSPLILAICCDSIEFVNL
jgi:hypothetical protein